MVRTGIVNQGFKVQITPMKGEELARALKSKLQKAQEGSCSNISQLEAEHTYSRMALDHDSFPIISTAVLDSLTVTTGHPGKRKRKSTGGFRHKKFRPATPVNGETASPPFPGLTNVSSCPGPEPEPDLLQPENNTSMDVENNNSQSFMFPPSPENFSGGAGTGTEDDGQFPSDQSLGSMSTAEMHSATVPSNDLQSSAVQTTSTSSKVVSVTPPDPEVTVIRKVSQAEMEQPCQPTNTTSTKLQTHANAASVEGPAEGHGQQMFGPDGPGSVEDTSDTSHTAEQPCLVPNLVSYSVAEKQVPQQSDERSVTAAVSSSLHVAGNPSFLASANGVTSIPGQELHVFHRSPIAPATSPISPAVSCASSGSHTNQHIINQASALPTMQTQITQVRPVIPPVPAAVAARNSSFIASPNLAPECGNTEVAAATYHPISPIIPHSSGRTTNQSTNSDQVSTMGNQAPLYPGKPPGEGGFPPVGCFTNFPNVKLNIFNALLCPLCWFPKSCLEELEAHISWDHWNWTPFQCSYCPGVLRPTQYTLGLHMKEVHPDLPKKVICSIDEQKSAELKKLVQNSVEGLLQYQSHIRDLQAMGLQRNSEMMFQPPLPAHPPVGPLQSLQNQPNTQPIHDDEDITIIDQPQKTTQDVVSGRNYSSSAILSRPEARIQTPPFYSSIGQVINDVASSIVSNATTTSSFSSNVTLQQQPQDNSQVQPNNFGNPQPPASISCGQKKKRDSVQSKSRLNQIRCQLCSASMSSRIEVVHGHIYGHIQQSGLGYRYTCVDCTFGCHRKGDLYAHNKSSHDRPKGKHKDRTGELSEMFVQTRKLCFPNYEAEVTGTVVCKLCSTSLHTSKKSAHIHHAHLKDKSVQCGYCSYAVGRSSGGHMRRHIEMSHPGLPFHINDLMWKFGKKMKMLMEQCFGSGSDMRIPSEPRTQEVQELGSASTVLPVSNSKEMDHVDEQLPVEVECELGDGIAMVDFRY